MVAAMEVNTRNSAAATGDESGIAIRIKGVSKYFPIYDTPRDRLKQMVMPRLHRLFGRAPRCYHRVFHALNEVSFEIRRGETVGIIGRNGAGKSTLLQIISGTLTPSAGTVETRGRIAALLELGAGFNPEFTGRENVFMNGSILGLTHEEVARRFDEIAAFADIGEFIDRPVKTYSSGMYVRLAFAVQACVDPEILIVDEALSVGDIGFQYKCFKRMEALREKGVTILMVTHSTGSILEYADRCIVLDGGRVIHDTPDVLAAVLAYEKGMMSQAQTRQVEPVLDSGRDAR
ncbi:MAG: ABC transporter ATP-binding protein, partial [Thiobacillus sp.]|nr:ABC transporter ATP-binding protein [Thiobacillus sp.]